VDGVSFSMAPQETWGLVGESGCGKSVTAYSVLRLLPLKYCRIVQGTINFQRRNGDVVDLAKVDPRGDVIRNIRGNEIAMIFQEPMTSLSPCIRWAARSRKRSSFTRMWVKRKPKSAPSK